MLRCNMSLALAHRLDATLYNMSLALAPQLPADLRLDCPVCGRLLDMMKSFMFRYKAGCKMWNLLGKLAKIATK